MSESEQNDEGYCSPFDLSPLYEGQNNNDVYDYRDPPDNFFVDPINNDGMEEMCSDNNKNKQNSSNAKLILGNVQSTRFTTNNLVRNLNPNLNQTQKEKKDEKENEKDNKENIIEKKNDEKNIENNEYTKKKRKRSKNYYTEPKINIDCGRKKKGSDEKGNHTKNSEDNIITKIKIFIINSILVLLNNSFIYYGFNTASINNRKFLKIEPTIYVSNKKDNNLLMLKMTVRELLYNEISDKNSSKEKNHNKELIDEIYNQNKETDIIKILNLTFGEFLNFFRGTISDELEIKLSSITNVKEKFRNITDFENSIREESKKKETKEAIDSYIKDLKYLCFNYENWFNNKKGRKREKKIIK